MKTLTYVTENGAFSWGNVFSSTLQACLNPYSHKLSDALHRQSEHLILLTLKDAALVLKIFSRKALLFVFCSEKKYNYNMKLLIPK